MKGVTEICFGHPQHGTVLNFAVNLINGGLPGGLSMIFVYPLDTWRTQDALAIPRSSFFESYQAFGLSVFGIFAYRGLYFGLYDIALPMLDQNANGVERFALGYGVTIAAGVLTYPLDTVRRRMMVAPFKYPSVISCVTTICETEGIEGLFGGCLENVARVVVGGMVLVAVDGIREWYVAHRQNQARSKVEE